MIVAAIATICSWKAGEIVKSRSESLLRNQVVRRLVRNSLYASETFTAYMHNLDEAVQLMTEIVQDRIVGYPEPGWEDDTYVPFLDKETGRNKYPLKSPFLRMDWDIERNINMSNIIENLQERGPGLTNFAFFLSSRPSYFMQGVCDPSEIDASAPTFFENCTSANNDYVTGGVIAPTPTSKGLYEKAADIGILLKPLFEAAPDVSSVGVYFYNSGAGSMVQYPGNVAGVAWNAYISEGLCCTI